MKKNYIRKIFNYKTIQKITIPLSFYSISLLIAGGLGYEIHAQQYTPTQTPYKPSIRFQELQKNTYSAEEFEIYQKNMFSESKGTSTNMYVPEKEGSDTEQDSRYQSDTVIITSKNGSTYYYPWCKGVSRIKEENKIYIKNESEAQTYGLKKASSCK